MAHFTAAHDANASVGRYCNEQQAEFAVILKMNPMFADLGPDELQRISGLCHTQQLGLARCCSRRAMPATPCSGSRRGQIRIETGASDGSRLTLNFMGPGDLFGEVAVLDGQDRTADATAGEPTELFVLRREDFLGHLEREPKVAIKIIMLLCQRIRWQSERMRSPCCSRCRFDWRGGSARWRRISARKCTSRRNSSAYSSAPHAKASTVSCSSGARTVFWTCSAAGFSCRT